jgi:hypothetical protein
MNKDKALKMAHKTFMQLNERSPRKDDGSGYFDKEINACKEALEQPAQEHNFCSRCGKRASKDLNQIHTCTPPNK